MNCNTMCNLQCDQALENIEKASYLHVTNYELRALLSPPYCLSGSDEAWLSANYERAYKLLEIDTFQTAVHASENTELKVIPTTTYAVAYFPEGDDIIEAWTKFYYNVIPENGYKVNDEHNFYFEYYPNNVHGKYELWVPVIKAPKK